MTHKLPFQSAVRPLVLAAVATASPALWSQDDPHAGHNMGSAPSMDMKTEAPSPTGPGDESPATGSDEKSEASSHEDMQMNGGDASADVRNPHAYSSGYTLVSGPYAHPGERLRLADEHHYGSVLVDRLERVDADDEFTGYEAQAWLGGSFIKTVIKAEGEYADGKFEEAETQLLHSRAIAPFWDVQAGLRYDYTPELERPWLALGVQGLAPYWFEMDTTFFYGEGGQTSLALEAEYELLITQRLIVQPRIEINLYGKNEPEWGIGSGIADSSVGIRLRYEFVRQFAPYVGVEWINKYGKTADYYQDGGDEIRATQYVAGFRFWF